MNTGSDHSKEARRSTGRWIALLVLGLLSAGLCILFAVVWIILPPTKLGLRPHAIGADLTYLPLSQRIRSPESTQAIVFRDAWYERKGSGWFVLLPPYSAEVMGLEIGLKSNPLTQGFRDGGGGGGVAAPRTCTDNAAEKSYGWIGADWPDSRLRGIGRCWRTRMDLSQVIPAALPAKRHRFRSDSPSAMRARFAEVQETPGLIPLSSDYGAFAYTVSRSFTTPVYWTSQTWAEALDLDPESAPWRLEPSMVQVPDYDVNSVLITVDRQRIFGKDPDAPIIQVGEGETIRAQDLSVWQSTVTISCNETAEAFCAALTPADISVDLAALRNRAILQASLDAGEPVKSPPDAVLPAAQDVTPPIALEPLVRRTFTFEYLEVLTP